jgi:hypothetical protein
MMRSILVALLMSCACCDSRREPETSHVLNEKDAEPAPVLAAVSPNLLRMQISQAQNPLADSKVALKFTFRNMSHRQALWVRTSVLIDRIGSLVGNVWLEVTNLDGQAILPNCRIRPGPPGTENRGYVHLQPGAEVSVVQRLECHDFSPGTFDVIAHYRDRSSNPPPPPSGAAWFAGELRAEPIQIQVAERLAR